MTRTFVITFNLNKILTHINYNVIIPLLICLIVVLYPGEPVTLPRWLIALIPFSFAILLTIFTALFNEK